MKTITSNQRTINIINKAVELGFKFNEEERLENIRIAAEEYLVDNSDHTEEECEVKSLGNHGQHIDWADGMGYEYWTQGQIVDFSTSWHKDPETKVFVDRVINSEGVVVDLFYLVGETTFNAPEGYYYSEKNKCHVKEEAND